MTDAPTYWISRLIFEKSLALIYLVAFLVAANQYVPLLGSHGLLPIARFTAVVPFRESPSLFYFTQRDATLTAASWLGVALSLLVLTGLPQRSGAITAGIVWGAMWLLYLSFVNVGQTFYGFGWESLLLRDGLLRDVSRRTRHDAEPRADRHLAVDAVPPDVRRRADQDPRRQLLARPDVSRLLFPDAADAESAELVLSLAAADRASRRRASSITSPSWACRWRISCRSRGPESPG